MTRDQVLAILGHHRPELEQLGVVFLGLFGSIARDDAGPESDVDVLVQFGGSTTFDRYMTLKLFLEDVLGRPVDLVTRDALRPRLRARVEAELVRVA